MKLLKKQLLPRWKLANNYLKKWKLQKYVKVDGAQR